MYGVLLLRETLELEIYGMTTKVPLCWYNGMTGAIPIFKTREEALSYVNGDESQIFKLKEI